MFHYRFDKNQDLSIYEFMHEFWTTPIANMMYTRSQNYIAMVVGKHGIQTFKVMIIRVIRKVS